MANSSTAFLRNNSKVPSFSSTIMNYKTVIRWEDIIKLYNVIVNPDWYDSIISKPEDWLASLTYYPFDIYSANVNTPFVLKIGNHDTNIVTKFIDDVNNRYYNVGEYYVSPILNNFADYNGYSKIEIYLPYFGLTDVHPNDCLNKWLQFRLLVDYNSGQGTYFIGVSNNSITNGDDSEVRIISILTFQLGVQIPINSVGMADLKRNLTLGTVKAGMSIASSLITGAFIPVDTSTTHHEAIYGRSKAKGSRMKMLQGEYNTTTTSNSHRAERTSVNTAFEYSVEALNNMKLSPTTDRVNNPLGLYIGSESIQIIRYIPKIVDVDETYNHIYGRPLGEVKTLNEISGYTEVSRIHFENENFGSCTSTEYAMIEQLFTNGVILPYVAGLYDENYTLIASWDTLVNTYGMNVEKNYTSSTYKTDTASPYYVLTKNSELNNGSKLIIDDSVTSIGDNAFYTCYLTSVTIRDGVTSIGDMAFMGCSALTTIEIPNSVTSMGTEVFNSCRALEYNEFDNGYYLGNKNNPYLLLVKSKDKSITTFIPHSKTRFIHSYAFNGCTLLTNINFVGNGELLSIGDNAFQKCCLLTNINIPRSVKSIGTQLFRLCQSSPLSIDVDENNQYYKSIDGNLYTKDGKTLVYYCIGKQEKSFIAPYGVTSIGDCAFYNCSFLTSIEIGDAVTSIGRQAFDGCTSLTSIDLPLVTSMGWGAFSGCKALTSIDLPLVTSIGDRTFQWCDLLTSVTIGNSVTSIGDSAFYDIAITSIIIPNSVTSIGEMAFQNCSLLTSVTIGNSVTSIGRQAFFGCVLVDNIIFNGTVEQWNAIEKGVSWDGAIKATYVQCTDGQVNI